jgi:hypothetical protein
MIKNGSVLLSITSLALSSTTTAQAQQPEMSFFVSSVGKGSRMAICDGSRAFKIDHGLSAQFGTLTDAHLIPLARQCLRA